MEVTTWEPPIQPPAKHIQLKWGARTLSAPHKGRVQSMLACTFADKLNADPLPFNWIDCGDRQMLVIYWALNFIGLQHKIQFFCIHLNCKNKIWLYASPNSVLLKEKFSLYCLSTCIFLSELWLLTSTTLIFRCIQNLATLIEVYQCCWLVS